MFPSLLKESGLIYEFVKPDVSSENSLNSRLINPGHGIEAMWFKIVIGIRRKDKNLIEKATHTIIMILEFSWEEQYGRIFYFLEAKGHPPHQLEWDQKRWWVYLEALIALQNLMRKLEIRKFYPGIIKLMIIPCRTFLIIKM